MPPSRRHKIGLRRRVEDEGDDHDDLDNDSLSEGSLASDEHDLPDDSDTSNIDESSPKAKNATHETNGTAAKDAASAPSATKASTSGTAAADTEAMLNGLSLDDKSGASQQELPSADDTSAHAQTQGQTPTQPQTAPAASAASTGPVIVSSASGGRRRQEHEDYKKRRDEDPAFVPNRGNFFMHDHRHPGPAANGFRPFGRGRGRGGRMGFGGPAVSHMNHAGDPIISSEWKHDMHDAVINPTSNRHQHQHQRPVPQNHLPPAASTANNFQHVPKCPPSQDPINRILSTEKHIGNAHVRVMLPYSSTPKVLPPMHVKQYTKLPDHRPPLRRDKAVRISLPNVNPSWIYPADDRSFIFIPRALRPNQQRMRGKHRSGLGSLGGYSRRTSVAGAGSFYGGSAYSPSVAMSRRSSAAAYDRDAMFSPTGSIASRAPVSHEAPRPVVRLPPMARPDLPGVPAADTAGYPVPSDPSLASTIQTSNYPLPQHRPAVAESYPPVPIALHQPRPQKNISVADLDTADLSQEPSVFQGTFHQQIPVQMAQGLGNENHSRQSSYPSQHANGTPLSQIPERAIHAAPFHPHMSGQNPQSFQPHQQANYYQPPPQPYAASMHPQQSHYYPPTAYAGPSSGYEAAHHADATASNEAANAAMVAQEANGMVYYNYPGQMPSGVPSSFPYPAPQPYQSSVVGMGGMVTPSPDGYYYPHGTPANGMMYY